MIDTNEQLKELFSLYQQVDETQLNDDYWIDRENPVYWICVDTNGDLCCGKATDISQIKVVLACRPRKTLFFRKRDV